MNKRVRGVVDEANGLMHLRPRESTYSAQEYNAAQSIGMNCGSHSIKLRIGRKSGGEAGKAHHTRMIKILLGPSIRPGARQETRLRGDTNGHAIPCSRGVVGVRESARKGCAASGGGPPLGF